MDLLEQWNQIDTYEESVKHAAKVVDNPDFKQGLVDAEQQVGKYLKELEKQNKGKKLVMVVGGKSRRLTEIVLQETVNRMTDDSIKEAFQQRVRLNESANRFLYGERVSSSSRQRGNSEMPDQLSSIPKEVMVVYIDDSVDSGLKAGGVLETLKTRFSNVKFVAMAGEVNLDMAPKKLKDNAKDFFVPRNQPLGYSLGMGVLSKAYSAAVNVRLNKQLMDFIPSVKISLDKLDSKIQEKIRTPQKLATSLKKRMDT
jgi:hypothetical protein